MTDARQVKVDDEVRSLNAGLKEGVAKVVKGWIVVAVLIPVSALISIYVGFGILDDGDPMTVSSKPLLIAVPLFLLHAFFIFRWWLK